MRTTFAKSDDGRCPSPRKESESEADVLGQFLRDVMRENMTNFRVFGPDETASNQLQAVYEATKVRTPIFILRSLSEV